LLNKLIEAPPVARFLGGHPGRAQGKPLGAADCWMRSPRPWRG